MADAVVNRGEEPDKILKDIYRVDEDDSKADVIAEEEVSNGEIQEAAESSNESASKTKVGNEEMSTCKADTDEDVKEMNYDKESMEDLISKLHINVDQLRLPTIGKQAKDGSSPLNYLRCRGRSTLLLFYRLWKDHLLKKPPPRPL